MKKRQRRMMHRRIDGELGREETRVFEKGIQGDASAREEYGKLRIVTDTTQRLKKIPAPPGFSGRVVRRIFQKGRKKP